MQKFFINERLLSLASNPDTLLVYPHAPRTGGVTLRKRVLAKVYGTDKVYNRHYTPNAARWKRLTEKELEGFRAYTDLDYCRDIGLKRPHVFMASIRNPLYRTVSLYGFIRRLEKHRHHEKAASMNMDEFYQWASENTPKYFRNSQCRRICGKPDAETALTLIREKYIGVGFTNHLTDFVLELCNVFNWPRIELERRGLDPERYDGIISPGFRDMVLADNEQDMILFETITNGLSMEGYVPVQESAFSKDMKRKTAALRTRIARLFLGRSRKKRPKLTAAATPEGAINAASNSRACNICGKLQDTPEPNRICPHCNASDRERSFPILFDSTLKPMFSSVATNDALLLSPAGIERKLLSPEFKNVTTSSLFNTYKGNFVRADVRDLAPFSDATFDFAQACNVLDYVPELESAIRAVHRVLRPNGVFSFHIVDTRLRHGDAKISVSYRKNVKVNYYPKDYAVPDVRIGRNTLKSMLEGVGFDWNEVPIVEPVTLRTCTWWICRKPD